ncbi:MAG: WecB/TagA/CpsF family glycosyltransferase [Alphaproteobacteria bacterium]|nr:WecB/TagA/CpsF family glycosyltransferase [Alphaproteobacteria bacterium]
MTQATGLETGRVIGAPVTVGTLATATATVLKAAEAGGGGYVCVANVHMVTTARRDSHLLDIMEKALWVTSDGMPLVWTLRAKGHGHARRVAGPDLMLRLLEEAEKKAFPVYFFGGDAPTAEAMRKRLPQQFPNLKIAGIESPPLLPLTPVVDEATVRRINESGAGLVFVGLGCPKQEYWMAAHAPHLKGVQLGVGAAFNFFAGTVRRAPRWMQRGGLEWLFRLAAEPRYLWKRYLVTNSLFIWYTLGSLLGSKGKRA